MVAESMNTLGCLYLQNEKYNRAEALFTRALEIWEDSLGPEHPKVILVLENYCQLLRLTKRSSDADKLDQRLSKMRYKKSVT